MERLGTLWNMHELPAHINLYLPSLVLILQGFRHENNRAGDSRCFLSKT